MLNSCSINFPFMHTRSLSIFHWIHSYKYKYYIMPLHIAHRTNSQWTTDFFLVSPSTNRFPIQVATSINLIWLRILIALFILLQIWFVSIQIIRANVATVAKGTQFDKLNWWIHFVSHGKFHLWTKRIKWGKHLEDKKWIQPHIKRGDQSTIFTEKKPPMWGKQNESHNSFSWHWNQLYSVRSVEGCKHNMTNDPILLSHHLKEPNKWTNTLHAYINEDDSKKTVILA